MPYPRAIQQQYMLRRYSAQRQFFIVLLGGKCRKCKCSEFKRLQIDHVDPALKKINLGLLCSKRTILAAIVELVTKCQVLCEECHRKKTAFEQSQRPLSFKHGSIYGWMKAKCPCEACERAKWEWHDARNARRRKRSLPNVTTRGRGEMQTRRL